MRRYLHQFNPNAYSDNYLLQQVPEEAVQKAALDRLAAERIPALAVDAGANMTRKTIASRLRRQGVNPAVAFRTVGASFAGLTDIVGTLPWNGRALYVEVKAPAWYRLDRKNHLRVVRDAGEPSLEQLAFMDTMAEAGALVGVVWSPEDMADLIGSAR